MLIKDEWINRLVYEIKLGKFVGYANRAHETIKKKDLQLFFCFLILIVVFLSWRFGLFSEGIISNNDHSYHYYQAWYTVNYLIPKFNSIIGWSPYFYGGHPVMHHYPPGNAIILSLLHLGSNKIISLEVAQRILILITLIVTPLAAYFFAREFGFNRLSCFIIGLVSIIPSFRHMEIIYWGMVGAILATGISPLVFAFLHRYYMRKRMIDLFLSSVFFAIVILVHIIIAIGVGIGVALYIFLRRDTNPRILLLFVIPFMLTAFWVMPAAQYYLTGYGSLDVTLSHLKVKTILGFINYHIFLLIGVPLYMWPFIFCAHKNLDIKKDFSAKFIVLYPITIYIVAYFGSSIPLLQDIQLLHLMPYLGAYVVILGGASISNRLSNEPHRFFTILTLVMIISIPLFSTFIFSRIINPQTHTILTSDVPENVRYVFGWIKENNQGRTMLEDTDSKLSEIPWGTGYNLALAPVYAENAMFIGGAEPYYNPFWTGNRTKTQKHVFFGMTVESIDYDLFRKYLEDFNINHVILWSQESKNFLDRSDDFELVERINWFSIYRYLRFRDSFIVRTSCNASARVTEFGVNEIKLHVKANEPSDVTVSSSYYPNWHAYADGRELPVSRDDIFTQVTVPPKDGEYEVVLVFEESRLESFSKWLSLVSWIIVLPAIVLMRWRGL